MSSIKHFKQYCSRFLRELILRHYLVPYSRHGLDPALVRWWKPTGPVAVVDVGASSGFFMEAVAKHHTSKRGFLIEPLAHRCNELRTRFAEPVFTVLEGAAAEAEGVVQFNIHSFDYASSMLDWPGELNGRFAFDMSLREKVAVKTMRLDDILAANAWNEEIDLLKIDVQGAEMLVLLGGEALLPRLRHIYVELAFREVYRGGCTFNDVYKFLTDRGFQLLEVTECARDASQTLEWVDVLFRRQT
jgi:FkbM family methyltransferase